MAAASAILIASDEMVLRLLATTSVPEPFPTLRSVGFAAFSRPPEETVASADRRGVRLIGLYGMSEVQALFSCQSPTAPAVERAKRGGRPVSPQAEVRVCDPETGRLLPVGESGELLVKGPSLMAGYYQNPGDRRRLHRRSGSWSPAISVISKPMAASCSSPAWAMYCGWVILRGLPFALGPRGRDPRWLLVDRPIELDLGSGSVSHVVVAHFSDSWRADDGHRPSGRPVGWVLEAGEPLARYEVLVDGEPRAVVDVRRRYEVVDGIIGWGYLPFAAIGHRWDALLDWRGPYGRQGAGDYAPAGHGGPLTILPGAWGGNLTGVADALPSGEGELTLWLTSIPIDARPAGRITMRVTPLANGRPGSDVVIAGVTRFAGSADPLVLSPRRQVIVNGWHGLPTTDLGLVIAARPLDSPPVAPGGDGATSGPIGWGSPRPLTVDGAPGAPSVLDLAIASDARLGFGEWSIAATELAGELMSPDGRITVRPVAPDVRVSVRIQAAGAPAAARVRFVAEDGRYRPPIGHREEVNTGAYEDSGLGLVLGTDTWAYVPAAFDVDLPVGRVTVEAVHGFEHRPIRRTLDIAPGTRALELHLDRAIDASAAGWMSVDPHVHFLSPSSALLQAEAEDVDLVQLLACQLGDEMAGVANLPYGILRSEDGRTVMTGTENRQNVLGHVALLGARTPVMPLSSGGAPEGRVGAPVDELLADWADRCHASGGLVVGAHFPLPLAEVAACLVEGVIDAVEMQTFAPGWTRPPCWSGTASSTAATACRCLVGPTRCRRRCRSARSGRTRGSGAMPSRASSRGRRRCGPAGPWRARDRSSSSRLTAMNLAT